MKQKIDPSLTIHLLCMHHKHCPRIFSLFSYFYNLLTVQAIPRITHNTFQLNWDQGLSKLDPLNNLNWNPSEQQTSQEVVSKVHRKALSRESSQGLWDLRRLSLLDGGPINKGDVMLLSRTREKLPELIGTHLLSRISTSFFQVPVDTNYGASGTGGKNAHRNKLWSCNSHEILRSLHSVVLN